MKNSKFLLVLAMLTYGVSSAQTVGDHLNYIQQKRPGGRFKQDPNNVTHFYNYEDNVCIWSYVLNTDLRCTAILVHPIDASDVNTVIAIFKERNYINLDSKHWSYYREDGSVLLVSLEYPDSIGPVFVITEQ